MRKKVSLKDIAEALNLSKATISWILSGKGEEKGFSTATIKRVKEYADSVNYRPNLLARSLSVGTSSTIGLVIPFLADTFYAQMAQSIELEAARKKYTLIVCSSEGDGAKEYDLIKILISKQVDGIILAPTKLSENSIELLSKSHLPFVLVDRYYPELNSNYVIVNNKECSYDLVSYLGKEGSKKIAMLTTDDHLFVMRQRIEGYDAAVKDLNLDDNLALKVFVDRHDYKKDIVNKLDVLLEKNPDVDAFFFTTHYLALETIRYFTKHKIDYHNRFKMGCFHYTSGLDILAPEMCMTKMNIEKMGVEAVNILTDNIQYGSGFDFRKVELKNTFFPSMEIDE